MAGGRAHVEGGKDAKQPAEAAQDRRGLGQEPAQRAQGSLYGDLVAAGHGGEPLAPGDRAWFERRLGGDLGGVRLHGGEAAERVTGALGAAAVTEGQDVMISPRAPGLDTPRGQRLLGHELAHTIQYGRGAGGGGGEPAAALEREAAGAAATTLGAASPVRGRAAPGTGPLCQDEGEDETAGDDEAELDLQEALAGWTTSRDSFLIIPTDDEVFVLPARFIVYTPSAEAVAAAGSNQVFIDRDLGALLEAPAVGAAGTRVIRIGRRSAVVLDAGSDTRGVPSAVFLDQLQAALGGRNVTMTRVIHVHGDHVNQIPTLLRAYPGATISVPAAYLRGPIHPSLQRVLDTVRADPAFGPTWSPVAAADTGGPTISSIRYRSGDVVFEQVALRSALSTTTRTPDLASYLTRVTRTTDGASIVVLGDLRMADLARFRTEMEAARPGSWAEFFQGVTRVSGFSHHAGALRETDIPGLMALLDVTLFRTGRLQVVEQTNLTSAPSRERQTRADTLEFAQRIGIDVVYAGAPTAGAPPSSVGTTRDTVTATGPDATRLTPIASPHTDALARLQRMIETRRTIELWRPVVDARGTQHREAVDRDLVELDASIETLRQALRTSTEAAARVRATGTRTPGGARDYALTGGLPGATYQGSLGLIPATTPAETRIGPEGFRAFERLRARSIEQVPLQVALEAAFRQGVYSDQAFRYMLAQMDPAARDSILYGRRGGPRPRDVAFRRLRAEFGFRSSVMPSGHSVSLSGMSPSGRVGARGVAGILLLVEAVNLGSQVAESVRISNSVSRQRYVVPFVRRLLFWDQLGVRPALVGVSEPLIGEPTYERDYDTVVEGLSTDEWDALYIEHSESRPALSDMDVLRLGAHLAAHVRNYDEFATLFEDSDQDAVRYVRGGEGGWANAEWQVRVAHYDTDWENEVMERWEPHARLTELMQTFVRRIISNTQELLRRQGAGEELPASDDEDSPLGSLSTQTPPAGARRARLRGAPATSTVYVEGGGDQGWGPNLYRLIGRELTWWSPPVFFVHEPDRTGYVRVSGADYNTFAILRRLKTEEDYTVMGGHSFNAARTRITGNTTGLVYIPEAEIEYE